MQNYLSNLRQRFNNPLRIRIGGNSMDGSTFVPDQQVMIEFTDPDAYFNDVPVNFGPIFFDVLNSMADDVGEMQFIIGLSMREPSEDSNVILLANAAEQMMGYRLDAMLLGNVRRFVQILVRITEHHCRNQTFMQTMERAETTPLQIMYVVISFGVEKI